MTSRFDPTWELEIPFDLELKDHPCPYSDPIIDVFQHIVDNIMDVADPKIIDHMAGIGRIHELVRCRTFANEIEPEWAYSHPKTLVGDARYLPWPDKFFDGVFFSPPYGNRLADKYQPKESDKSGRKSYVISLDRLPLPGSSSTLKWGEDYRDLSIETLIEAKRVLKPGGLLAINVKGHYKNKELVDVSAWYERTIESLDMSYLWGVDLVNEQGWTFSPTRDRDSEKVLVFRK